MLLELAEVVQRFWRRLIEPIDKQLVKGVKLEERVRQLEIVASAELVRAAFLPNTVQIDQSHVCNGYKRAN